MALKYDEKIDNTCINSMKVLAVEAVEKANSGHPGLPMGAADVATALFTKVMKFDAAEPHWPDRDRFILSGGHGCALLYSLLHLTGYDLSLDELKNFRQWGSKTPGHPEYGHGAGVVLAPPKPFSTPTGGENSVWIPAKFSPAPSM